MAQPYDVYIFVGILAITMIVLYSAHFCCSCARAKSAHPQSSDVEMVGSGDVPLASAAATEESALKTQPTTETPTRQKLTLFAPQCVEAGSWSHRGIGFAARFACSLTFAYLLTLIIVGILLGPAPGWVLYDPAPDSECVADCGSEQFCCSYNLFNAPELNATRVSIDSKFGSLDGFLMRNVPANATTPPLTILYSHGSGWNVAVQYRLKRYAFLMSLGNVQVLTYDYAGYGASPGEVNEANVKESSLAALQWLQTEAGVHPANVTLLGRSLGGAVTASLVQHVYEMGDSVHAAVVESSWDFFSDVVGAFFPMTAFVAKGAYDDWWRSADSIAPLTACYFQFHSEDDEQVPLSTAEGLFEAADAVPPSCKRWVKVAGPLHDDPMPAEEKDALREWFNANRA